jgi:drug/metabolite transporter (DMT)-like permease
MGGGAFAVPAKRSAPAHVALTVVVILWGMSFTSTKIILNTGFPPLTIALLRFAIASAVMLAILKARNKRLSIPKGDILPLGLSGLLGVTLYFFFENRGIKLTSASNASLIIATIPVFTVAAEMVFFRHRVPLVKMGGIGLSIAGVYFLINPGGTPGGASPSSANGLAGSLLMLGACFSWVAYIILSKKFAQKLPRLALTAYQFLFGTLFLIPLSLFERRAWVAMGTHAWLNLLFLALLCSAAGYFLYLYGLFRLDPTTVSSYINLIPVVGALSGIFVLGERLVSTQIIGGAAVIAGVVIVNVRMGGKRKNDERERRDPRGMITNRRTRRACRSRPPKSPRPGISP